MATLNSPGVSVSVIDESFYTPSAPGTTPLIIVASAENKQNGSGTGTAPGTLAANAGKVYLLTSQKDLADNFGTPVFKTDANNNPIHAGEQNEFGLQAAYSYLGVSNRAFVVRAGIDLSELDAKADVPSGPADNGTIWFDTANSTFGIFQWNGSAATVPGGQSFTNKVPLVVTASADISGSVPAARVGAVGDYALVLTGSEYNLCYKNSAGSWVQVGSTAWKSSLPITVQTTSTTTLVSGDDDFVITVDGNDTTIDNVTSVDALITAINLQTTNTGVSANKNVANKLQVFFDGREADFTISGNTVEKLGLVIDKDGVALNAGIFKAPALQISPHYTVPTWKRSILAEYNDGQASGSVWIKSTEPNLGARWRVKIYNSTTGAWTETSAPIHPTSAAALKGLDSVGGGVNLPINTLYVKSNVTEATDPNLATFKIFARKNPGTTVITEKASHAALVAGDNTFTVSYTQKGSATLAGPVTVSFTGASGIDALIASMSTALGAGSRVTANKVNGKLVITHLDGGDIFFNDGSNAPLTKLFGDSATTRATNWYDDNRSAGNFDYVASNWSPNADITTSATAPTTEAVDGQLWYSSIIDEVDIMVHDGTGWKGLNNVYADAQVIVSATRPGEKTTDGREVGDIWIDSSDLENFPQIYRWNEPLQKWLSVNTTDQTTEDGVLFADARWSTSGADSEPATIAALAVSDFLDFDAPDPAIYPQGMLLWNLRRSGFNVKKFVRNYVNTASGSDNPRQGNESMEAYYPHRWVTESGNLENGTGTFGRKAQRKVVVQALQALVNANQQIRDEESRVFNLIACPGYPELIGEMKALNYDRGLTSFVVGDTPARLAADATTLNNWGTNKAGALEDGDDGLVSSDEYLGVFYPWGYTSDNLGNNIAVPPSHMILRTIALSDQVSYPWFAPAGTRRGGITNATAVGYVDAEGEFQSVALNNGQRDTLASIKVNPITFITGTGLVNYGQYTRAKSASSLDRINVARLVVYLRRQFAQLAKPYVFEPNDKITRDELKGAAESLLLELVGQRALYDYIVVCDTSNNTPERIDRNELYLDVAIEPVKAVEFIYIPLRLKNTGEIQGLTQ